MMTAIHQKQAGAYVSLEEAKAKAQGRGHVCRKASEMCAGS